MCVMRINVNNNVSIVTTDFTRPSIWIVNFVCIFVTEPNWILYTTDFHQCICGCVPNVYTRIVLCFYKQRIISKKIPSATRAHYIFSWSLILHFNRPRTLHISLLRLTYDYLHSYSSCCNNANHRLQQQQSYQSWLSLPDWIFWWSSWYSGESPTSHA